MRRRFLYCLDPVCLAATVLYVANRLAIKPATGGGPGFVHDYFNDVLCLPIFLPAVLLVQRGAGLRRDDRPPTPFEVLLHLVIWSIIFEGIAPLMSGVYRTTADVRDVAAYAVGALAAGMVWGTWFRTVRSGAAGP